MFPCTYFMAKVYPIYLHGPFRQGLHHPRRPPNSGNQGSRSAESIFLQNARWFFQKARPRSSVLEGSQVIEVMSPLNWVIPRASKSISPKPYTLIPTSGLRIYEQHLFWPIYALDPYCSPKAYTPNPKP